VGRLARFALLLALAAPARASDSPGEGAILPRWDEGGYRWLYSRPSEPPWLEAGTGLQLFRRAA
jgi:hypothetical protein